MPARTLALVAATFIASTSADAQQVIPLWETDAPGFESLRDEPEQHHAGQWGVKPDRIGVMGWSAGGEVAALVAYPPVDGDPAAKDPVERVGARPDFQILIYPGPLGVPEKIPGDAPPLFLLGAADDEYVAGVLFDLTRSYHAAGAPIETHIYAQG